MASETKLLKKVSLLIIDFWPAIQFETEFRHRKKKDGKLGMNIPPIWLKYIAGGRASPWGFQVSTLAAADA